MTPERTARALKWIDRMYSLLRPGAGKMKTPQGKEIARPGATFKGDWRSGLRSAKEYAKQTKELSFYVEGQLEGTGRWIDTMELRRKLMGTVVRYEAGVSSIAYVEPVSYYFTLGHGQDGFPGFVRVDVAPNMWGRKKRSTFGVAREIMFAKHGDKFAFQYDNADALHEDDRFLRAVYQEGYCD